MAENKTKPTKVSVAEFLKRKATAQQLADSRELVTLFREITGKPAKMWGPSIVGFGSYHYIYESGRQGDAPLLGFSPRKPKLVLYLSCRDAGMKRKLGRHESRGGCMYISTLDDLDREVLRKLATASVAELRKRYPPRA